MSHISNSLDNARAYSHDIITNSIELKNLSYALSKEILYLKYPPEKQTNNKLKKVELHVQKVLSNLRLTRTYNCNYYSYFTLNKNAYKSSRYLNRDLSYTTFRLCIESLEELGYIEVNKGVHYSHFSRCSRMKPTKLLCKYLDDIPVDHTTFTRLIKEPIVLRKTNNDNETHSCDYKETKNTQTIRKRLLSINDFLSKQKIYLESEDVSPDYSATPMRRIFSESFKKGGRFYGGWWQNINSELRRKITINGESTVEADFKGMHIDMLYALENLEMPEDDPYQLEHIDVKYRKGLKKLFNAMINAKSARIDVNKKGKDNIRNALPKGVNIRNIKIALEIKHMPINKYLQSGKGIELQYLDSCIAEGVMLTLNKEGIACLPVHDSFIVQAKHKDKLKAVMAEQFRKVMGRHPMGIDMK